MGSFEIRGRYRSQRRFGVTANLTPEARGRLYRIRNDEGWPDLLDVMEMCCIEIETQLINTDAAQEAEVLANHKMAKAAWQIFMHLQQKVDNEISLYLTSITQQSSMPEATEEERLFENILDPTRSMVIEE